MAHFERDLVKLMENSIGILYKYMNSFFTSKMCFIFDDFDEYLNGEEIKRIRDVLQNIIQKKSAMVFVTVKPFNDIVVKFEQMVKDHTDEPALSNYDKFKKMFQSQFSVQELTRMEYQMEF